MRCIMLIVGCQGAGKTTLVDEVLKSHGGSYRRLISLTTRPQRPGEIDGVHYHFTDKRTFERMRDEGMLVEWETFDGHSYGTPVSDFSGNDHLVKVVTLGGLVDMANWLLRFRQGDFLVIGIHLVISEDSLRKALLERGFDDERIQNSLDENEHLIKQQGIFTARVRNEHGNIKTSTSDLSSWFKFGQEQAEMKSSNERGGNEMIKIRDGSISIRNNDSARHIVCESESRSDKLHYVTVDVEDGTILGCSCEAASMDPTHKCKHQKAVLEQRFFQM